MQIALSPRAVADFKQLTENLAEAAGLSVAERYASRIDDVFDLLATFPESGSPRPELGQGIRIRVIDPYIVFYAVVNSQVEVLRILHGKRHVTRDSLGTS